MVNIPVVLCFDSRIVLGAAVTIKSLIDNAKADTSYDIRVFHSDLSIKDQELFSSMLENTKHRLKFHYVNPERFKGAPRNKVHGQRLYTTDY